MEEFDGMGSYSFEEIKTRKANHVEIFVTSWCPHCQRLEMFLKEAGIAYKRHDIEESNDSYWEYQILGVSGVPLTKIGTHVIRGFMPNLILAILQDPSNAS